MTRRHALAAPAVCAILSPEVARADWRLLGSREVDHRVERHEIDTGIAGGLDGASLPLVELATAVTQPASNMALT
ncbi:MAG: hypothetical protein DIJKHBIC_01320 [Thermoanaerobaculia bacterium]|nr:hypothetical protein [Thermoanaerobaculia bacterium]